MGRFNLLDEPWISVFVKTGEKKEVSMMDFFKESNGFLAMAGEMETQNFAILRFLLSVVQTVFSRFDYNGYELPGVEIDERFRQMVSVDEDDLDDYCKATKECWNKLYSNGRFPDVLFNYLEKWRDRFYLFDEEHPFYQVNKNEMNLIMGMTSKNGKPTTIYGKNINRTISESENKIALFSPIANKLKMVGNEKRTIKDAMTEAELARWLITFQGYSGLADKVSITLKNQRSSKGWLFDLGGIYILGKSVYETIVMNYIPESPIGNRDFIGRCQRPCWELNGEEVVNRLRQECFIDNLAELYTNWSRAIYIDPLLETTDLVEIHVVKLPEVEHTERSIEPMTLWKWNESGDYKNSYTPKKHSPEQSLWRNFGIITMKTSSKGNVKQRQPGILEQYQWLTESMGRRYLDIVGISMQDDSNATSWLPINEIVDSLRINSLVLNDTELGGWIVNINDAVETTKEVISVIFRCFLRGICEIRNMCQNDADNFLKIETGKMYSFIDPYFKEWLSSIEFGDSKDNKIKEWFLNLRKIVLMKGEELFENSIARDLVGVERDGRTENIATKYWQFVGMLNKKINRQGDVS